MLLILHTNALLTLPYKVWPASRGSQAPGVVFLSDCQVETPRQVPETFWRVATPKRAKKCIKFVEGNMPLILNTNTLLTLPY